MRDWSIRHGIASVRHLIRVATANGASLSDCLQGTGLSEADLQAADTEITTEQELRMIRNVVRALPGVPTLALQVGASYQLTDFGIWGYALISSGSLREAMRLALRFLDLSYIYGELSLEESAGEIRLKFDYAAIPAEIRPFLLERDMAAIQAVQLQVAPQSRPMLRLKLGFARPSYWRQLEAALGMKPEYGADATEVVLDPRVLDRALPQANEATLRMCEAECGKLLARRRQRAGVSAKVRDIMIRTPAEAPGMEQVAAELHMTTRTLRRHLADEGTTFRALRDEVLMMLAEELLGTARMKLDEVAGRLGYSDSAAFSHAFKRWKGVSPGAVRRA